MKRTLLLISAMGVMVLPLLWGCCSTRSNVVSPDAASAEYDADAQLAEEAAAREARCNARRMNNPDMAQAVAGFDEDLAEAEQVAAESGDADVQAAVAEARAKSGDAKAAYRNGKYCHAYDLFKEAYGSIAEGYAAAARHYAAKNGQEAARQAATDAALYAEASHNDGLDCAIASSRNAVINFEIARDADKEERNAAAIYSDPNFANRMANEALEMASKSGGKPAMVDAKDASGKAYRGNLPECYAACAKSFAESCEAFAVANGGAEARRQVAEAKRAATEAAEAARMGNVTGAYRAAANARDAARALRPSR